MGAELIEQITLEKARQDCGELLGELGINPATRGAERFVLAFYVGKFGRNTLPEMAEICLATGQAAQLVDMDAYNASKAAKERIFEV